jgi:hypothetical protein
MLYICAFPWLISEYLHMVLWNVLHALWNLGGTVTVMLFLTWNQKDKDFLILHLHQVNLTWSLVLKPFTVEPPFKVCLEDRILVP